VGLVAVDLLLVVLVARQPSRSKSKRLIATP